MYTQVVLLTEVHDKIMVFKVASTTLDCHFGIGAPQWETG